MEDEKNSKDFLEENYQVLNEAKQSTVTEAFKEKDDFEQQFSSKLNLNNCLQSKLPEQQPLYQIYLLQEQQRINDSLEPIEEILNYEKQKLVKKIGREEKCVEEEDINENKSEEKNNNEEEEKYEADEQDR